MLFTAWDLERTCCHVLWVWKRRVYLQKKSGWFRCKRMLSWDYNDRSDLLSLVWFTGDAEAPAGFCFQQHRGRRASTLTPCVSDMGAIILIWARLNQMSDLQNYKITVLAGAVTEVNFSLISLLRDNIWFFSMVFYLFLPIPHQVGTCILILLSCRAPWKLFISARKKRGNVLSMERK